jgi:MYXO-CTERM domain-containing protein
MGVDFRAFDHLHLLGECATHPIRPPSGALAALLVLAGISLRRPRALPAHPMTTCSGASNCGF